MGIMTVVGLLKLLKEAGSATPAFKSLWDVAVSTFRSDEQEVLKRGYDEAMAKSDDLHDDVQSELKAAGKK